MVSVFENDVGSWEELARSDPLWAVLSSDEYRQFWEQSFDRLDEYLQRLQAEAKEKHGDSLNGTQLKDKEK